jgi:ABC-type Zn uptake system ZnuABC Zn-binding protein ZnuA
VAAGQPEVLLILSPGSDPHGFEPRPRDVTALTGVALVFAVGLGLDPWAPSLARSAGTGAGVFELGPLLDPILAPRGVVQPEAVIDSHFWLDPVRAQRAVDVIVEALSGLRPEEEPSYRLRAEEIRRSIHALHMELGRRAAGWRRRRIITSHGSFFYFAERYGLEVVGVVEPVPGREPSGRHMADLVGLLRQAEPPALFAEPQLDPQLVTSLARETRVALHEADPLGGRDATDSYEKILRRVADAMDEALR